MQRLQSSRVRTPSILKDDSTTVSQKVMRMYTDPTRLRATDPGHVEGNPVFQYHDAFNAGRAQVQELKDRYEMGKGRRR